MFLKTNLKIKHGPMENDDSKLCMSLMTTWIYKKKTKWGPFFCFEKAFFWGVDSSKIEAIWVTGTLRSK